MQAHHQVAPLVVVRSEAESGRVGLRLIGELDLNTVELLDAELARTREKSPPSVIDLSELRFLDLVGLRALLRAVESDVAGTARLVGATGIVRRLIELAHTLDCDDTNTAAASFPCERTTRIGSQNGNGTSAVPSPAALNGSERQTTTAANASANGNAPRATL
jgi:anti-anti-sigma factor